MGEGGTRDRPTRVPWWMGSLGACVGLGDLALSRSACKLAGFAETAVNIGFACQLLSENTIILEDKAIK